MTKKTIVITGAGSGIGKASALVLAQRGHAIIATTHTQKQADEMSQFAKESRLPISSFVLDITKLADRKKISTVDFDVLINNAAIGDTGSLAEIDMQRVRDTFETNVFATFELTQLVLQKMIPKNAGKVIFVSSVAGRVTSPFLSPYSMTKFALSNGAEALRKELKQLGSAVQVTLIEPGAFHTGFNQKMFAKKYIWMEKESYFSKIIPLLKMNEEINFTRIEQKSLTSIVNKIIQAVESEKPSLLYSAPWWQALYVRVVRAFGG